MKIQLFKFNEKDVGLVNLAVSKMNENGEMKAWIYNQGKIKEKLVTWNDLENQATIVEWPEIKLEEKNVLSKIAFGLIDEDKEKRDVFQPVHQLDEVNEVYKGSLVRMRR